ncbi:hypothetical protein D3C81_2236390 [compost metagenome]
MLRIFPAISAAIMMTMLAAVLLTSTDTINARIATTIPTNQIRPACIKRYFHWGTECTADMSTSAPCS